MHKRRMLCSSSTTRSRIRESSLVTAALLRQERAARRQYLRADSRVRKANQNVAAFGLCIVVAQNLAVVPLDDAVADAETQAGSFSDRLGSVERLKNAVGV